MTTVLFLILGPGRAMFGGSPMDRGRDGSRRRDRERAMFGSSPMDRDRDGSNRRDRGRRHHSGANRSAVHDPTNRALPRWFDALHHFQMPVERPSSATKRLRAAEIEAKERAKQIQSARLEIDMHGLLQFHVPVKAPPSSNNQFWSASKFSRWIRRRSSSSIWKCSKLDAISKWLRSGESSSSSWSRLRSCSIRRTMRATGCSQGPRSSARSTMQRSMCRVR